jgi:hypothetical protein
MSTSGLVIRGVPDSDLEKLTRLLAQMFTQEIKARSFLVVRVSDECIADVLEVLLDGEGQDVPF